MQDSVYESLKGEQTARIVLRDTALYTQIVLSGGVLGVGGFAAHDLFLIAYAFATFVIFCIYASNDIYVSQISKYIALTFPDASRWESWHRTRTVYPLQKAARALAVFGAFVLAPIAIALIHYFNYTPDTIVTIVVMGLLALLQLIVFVVLSAI